ncbi:MAG: hypothetical protein AB8H86_27310 [Polyangiales bacterium]
MRRASITLALSFALIACGDDSSVMRTDASLVDGDIIIPVPDAQPVDGGSSEDYDGDGLCNDTESERGTDPLDADTDGDGIPDGPEVLLGFDPTSADFPGRERTQLLRESPAGSVDVLIERDLFAQGQDLVASFSASPVSDLGGQDAGTFFVGASAAFASPAANFASIEDQSVRGVTGRILVGYELRFEHGDAVARECVRAYPYRYTIKRSDAVIVGVETRLLVVIPPGENLNTAEWCERPACR